MRKARSPVMATGPWRPEIVGRGSAADDLARLQAGVAGVDPHPLRWADLGPHGLDVGVPAAVGTPVRVRHRHAEAGPLAAHVANGSHVAHSPGIVDRFMRLRGGLNGGLTGRERLTTGYPSARRRFQLGPA